MPSIPSKEYVSALEALTKSADRTTAYRATAELEDIVEGHWDGPRTDDPPASWFHSGGMVDVDSGEPIILVLHLAKKQNKAPLTVYKSESGAFKLFIDWGYVLVSKPDQPGRTRHLHVPEHIELQVKGV
jgi:hypothetical protein